MAKPFSPWQRTFAELRRRRVLRAVGAYAVILWIVLQVSDVILPALGAPAWAMTMLVVVGISGVVVTVAVSWVYDMTADGIRRTGPASEEDLSISAADTRWVDYVIIGALVIVLALVLAAKGDDPPAPGRSIAVLPFVDISPNQDSQYFGDGIAEAIMDRLTQIPGLRVSARTSAFSFRTGDLDARQVATALGVDNLLEGSVRRTGERLRISARLIDGHQGTQLWSATFDGSPDEVFVLQDLIASAVAQVMQLRLEFGDEPGIQALTNAQAYDLYLRGRDTLRRKNSSEDVEQAIAHFRQALSIDSNFALAAAGLCRAMWERYELSRDPAQVQPTLAHCRRVDRDFPELAESRIAIGMMLLGTGRPGEAAEAFEQALARSPHQAEALAGLSLALRDLGRYDEAETKIRKAIQLDPAYWRYHWQAGTLHVRAGRHDQGIAALKRSIQLNPDTPDPYYSLGAVYFLNAEFLLAADAFRQSIERHPNAIAYSNAGTNYFYGGQFAQAEAMFEQAVELNPDDFRYPGFLAWSIRAQEGRGADAEPHHWQVVRAATERLAINQNDYEARAALALHLAALGHEPSAHGALASIQDHETMNMNVLATLGLANFMLGETERSARAYRQAIERGLPEFVLKADPRLEQAWSMKEFSQQVLRNPETPSTTQGNER